MLGNFLAGKTADLFLTGESGSAIYQYYWSIPLGLSVLVFLLILFFFKNEKKVTIKNDEKEEVVDDLIIQEQN